MPRVDRYIERTSPDEIVRGVLASERRLIARALRLCDDLPRVGRDIVSRLHPHRRGTRVIGITGNPGAGKSTVVDGMIETLRQGGKRVAVLAVDPSSPFSGGAILGDRIRMSRHFADDGVYIRSLATRGVLGGLSRSTFDSVRVLDAAGFDVVLLETVGVGQDEIDVVRLADTTVVVLVPGLGDDVQAIKAGLLEIADVFLINKADKEGVNDLERGLRHMLSLVPGDSDWDVPIVKTVASTGTGIGEAMNVIERHQQFLLSPAGESRRKARQRELFHRIFDSLVIERAREAHAAAIVEAARRVSEDGEDAYSVAEEVLGKS